jgi:hypothetical protein
MRCIKESWRHAETRPIARIGKETHAEGRVLTSQRYIR